MVEILKSVGYFFYGVLKRAYYWVFALLLDPFDLYNEYLHETLSAKYKEYIDIPSEWGLSAFILLIIWAGIMTYHEERKKNIRPKIKIEHKENEEGYYYDYYDEINYLLVPGVNLGTKSEIECRLCRISIRNLSMTNSIKNINVKLTEIEPFPEIRLNGKLPLTLKFQHNLINELNPQEKVFIDVVQWNEEAGEMPFYTIATTNENIITIFDTNETETVENTLPNHYKTILKEAIEYKIKISVTADKTTSIQKNFCFSLCNKNNTQNQLWMWPVD